MTILNRNTKKAMRLIETYKDPRGVLLADVYQNYSSAKSRAFHAIAEEMKQNNGYRPCIPTANQMVFTMAYRMIKDGVEWLVYHTPTNKYLIQWN